MNKLDLIEKFLESKGLIWVDRKVAGSMHNFYELVDATEFDFDKNTITQIPVKIKNNETNLTIEIAISVDTISFISYGIAFDTPSCFAVSDEYRDILDENNLSKEWQAFCLKNKGFVYKMAVDEFIKNLKREASENCHKQTIKHIRAITEQTELKKKIYSMADAIQQDINSQYENLEK